MASNPYPDRRRGVWLMKYRPDPTGKWTVVNLGKDPRLTGARPPRTPPQVVLDRAREFTEIEYRARHGISAAPVRAKGLDGYVAAYLEAYAATRKTGSAKQARRHLERFVAFAATRGVTAVQEVTRALCRDYLEHRITRVSHDTLKTEVGYLKPLWTRAVDEDGLMTRNPWARLKVPGKSTRSDPVFWSPEEIGRIAGACAKAWQTDLVLVLANTGLRISTTLALRWDWVRWDTGVITIPREVAARHDGIKTAYATALNRVARDVLQRRHFASRTGAGLVFPNPYRGGGPVPYDSAREAIMRAIKKAEVTPGTPHDLRHSYARALDRSGLPGSIVQAQLGHRSPQTTRIYTESTAEEAARYLEDFGIGEPPPSTPTPAPDDPSPPPA